MNMKYVLNFGEFIIEGKQNKRKNCHHLGSGPTYSDSPSDNVNSSITSSPTDTLRASKNSGAKIIKNLIPILAKIRKFKNNDFFIDYTKGWNGVLIGLRKMLQLQYVGNSNYADYKTPNGVFSFRISGHNANGNNFEQENINISVYVALFKYEHIPSNVKYKEFEITPETYDSNPAKVVYEIVNAVEQTLSGGTFTMSKDIAEEHPYDPETEFENDYKVIAKLTNPYSEQQKEKLANNFEKASVDYEYVSDESKPENERIKRLCKYGIDGEVVKRKNIVSYIIEFGGENEDDIYLLERL